MGWAIPIFSIRGTVIRIHITFLLFLVWLWAIFYRQGGAEVLRKCSGNEEGRDRHATDGGGASRLASGHRPKDTVGARL